MTPVVIFSMLTVMITLIYYKVNQCHGWYELFCCLLMSLLTQLSVVLLGSLIIEFYFYWLISY